MGNFMTLPYGAVEMIPHKHQRHLGASLLTLCPRLILRKKELFSFLSLKLVIFGKLYLLEADDLSVIPTVHFTLKVPECSEGSTEISVVPGPRATHFLRYRHLGSFWVSEAVPQWERKGVVRSQQGWTKDCLRIYACFI